MGRVGWFKDVVVLGAFGLREREVRGFIVAFVRTLVIIIHSCYYLRDDCHGLIDVNAARFKLRRLSPAPFQLIQLSVRNVLSYGSL